jgi:hypothetical protein
MKNGDMSQYLGILNGKIGIFWESSGRRDVGDVSFRGWSRSDVAAGT